MAERKTYGGAPDPRHQKMLDNSYEQTKAAVEQRTVNDNSLREATRSSRERTIEDKIERLRQRLKDAPIDANVRAILLGILDLLGDEL